jgi:hypothetical protein
MGTIIIDDGTPSAPATSIDLTTLANVKARAGVGTTQEDTEIQRLITAFSRYVMTRTSRTALNSIVAFEKSLNGKGGYLQLLPEFPITALTEVQINGEVMTLSTGYNVAGIAIMDDLKYIGFVGGYLGRFYRGFQNVLVKWSAGYSAVPSDLEQACCECVAIAARKKAWLDMKSKSTSVQGATATTTYRDWEIPPHEDRVLDAYTQKVVMW